LNPFQRRPCRPVCAWDKTLTLNDDDDSGQGTVDGREATGSGTGSEPSEAGTSMLSTHEDRVGTVLQAHRQTNLLTKFVVAGLSA